MANRQTYFPPISPDPKPAEIALHLRKLYEAANDHDQAIEVVNGKVGTVTNTITKVTTVSSGPPSPSPSPGFGSVGAVSNHTGVATYLTQQSDNGAKIIVSFTSTITITLNSGVTTPWFTIIDNNSASAVANLTPSSGTLNGEQLIPAGGFGLVFFDGTNFWCGATAVAPHSASAVAHQWLNSYTASTGVFTQTQPAYSDISGTPTLPANTTAVSHQWFSAYNSTTGAFTQSQPAFSDISGQITTSQLPASGISATITTAKLTTAGTQGSMTFVNGILTAQTPAT